MYSRKSIGPRTEPWETPALTGYSCEDFQSRTTQSCLLLTKEEKKPNFWPEIIWLQFVKKTSMLNPVKSLISSATVWAGPDNMLKALGILLDTTVRRSAVDLEDLKPYWKSEKRPHFSRWSAILLFTSFSKTLLNTEKRLAGQ